MNIIHSKKINNVVVASFDESITKFNALITEETKKALTSLFEKPGTQLILDLKGIKYVDSSGFGVFLSAMKTAKNSDGSFKICHINPDVLELFKLLQLHNIFNLCNTLEECLNSAR
ncbi:MAG: hypothetical protein DRI73_10175 [Bacteroidetes bacterium]|nr:MAG: hypothetical protein DRI73_10175 [Bacteroidota bacterium]